MVPGGDSQAQPPFKLPSFYFPDLSLAREGTY